MLPKYLRNGYTTIPEFFENRFDRQPRLIMSGLFLVFYLLIVIPTALYTGAIAFNKIFNLETIFGLSEAQAIVYTVIAIGVVGAIYAIFGGDVYKRQLVHTARHTMGVGCTRSR